MARYADSLLADGERVVLRARQHWLAPVIEGRIAWALLVASLVLVFLTTGLSTGIPRQIFGTLGLILLVAALVWLAVIYIGWYSEDYLVTNRRVLKVEGVLKKRSADSSLEKINDAVLEQSVLGRMLGYGDLSILTAAEEAVDRYHMLAAAPLFKRTMLDEKNKLEDEVFQIPAPPLRAAPAAPAPISAATEPVPAVAGATAGGGTAAMPRTTMTSAEITTALGNLADLRDRGAISAEEYEAKKQDLLGRL